VVGKSWNKFVWYLRKSSSWYVILSQNERGMDILVYIIHESTYMTRLHNGFMLKSTNSSPFSLVYFIIFYI